MTTSPADARLGGSQVRFRQVRFRPGQPASGGPHRRGWALRRATRKRLSLGVLEGLGKFGAGCYGLGGAGGCQPRAKSSVAAGIEP